MRHPIVKAGVVVGNVVARRALSIAFMRLREGVLSVAGGVSSCHSAVTRKCTRKRLQRVDACNVRRRYAGGERTRACRLPAGLIARLLERRYITGVLWGGAMAGCARLFDEHPSEGKAANRKSIAVPA